MTKDKDCRRHENDYPIEDVWGTYHKLAHDIVQRLEAFKAIEKHGPPEDIKDMRQWNNVIRKMIDAFELMKYNSAYTDEENKTISEGLELFCKYFRNLWD